MTLKKDDIIIIMLNDVYYEYGGFDIHYSFTQHIIRIFDEDERYKGLLAFEDGKIEVFTGEDEEERETFIYNKDGSITIDMEVGK